MKKFKDHMIDKLVEKLGITSADVISHDGPVFEHLFPPIDMKTAKWIDKQLDWEDAVSFTFIVVENVDTAFKICS